MDDPIGGIVCSNMSKFTIFLGGTKYNCVQNSNCVINKSTRRQCQACRLTKCFENGMSDTWVMTETDKIEKKEAAEVRKRLKMEATQNNDRSIDLTTVPLSGYLQKRAHFKQEMRRGKNGLASSEYQNQEQRTRSNSGEFPFF